MQGIYDTQIGTMIITKSPKTDKNIKIEDKTPKKQWRVTAGGSYLYMDTKEAQELLDSYNSRKREIKVVV